MCQRPGDETQIVASEGDIGRLDGRGRSLQAHRNPHRRGRKRGRIVDAVAYHRSRARHHESLDRCSLIRGQLFRTHVGDPRLPGDRAGGAFVVAGEHDRLDALSLQHPHRLGRFCAKLVPHPDETGDLPLGLDDHDGHTFGGHLFGRVPERGGVEPAGVARSHGAPIDASGHAPPGLFDHIGRSGGRGTGGDDRRSQGVRARRF